MFCLVTATAGWVRRAIASAIRGTLIFLTGSLQLNWITVMSFVLPRPMCPKGIISLGFALQGCGSIRRAEGWLCHWLCWCLEQDLRCGSSRSGLKHDGMCSQPGIRCGYSLSAWYFGYRFLKRWSVVLSWKPIGNPPCSPLVSSRPFLKIRHLLLSLHFSRGFLYCL